MAEIDLLVVNWPITAYQATNELLQLKKVLLPTNKDPNIATRRAGIRQLLLRSTNRMYAHAMHLAQWCVPYVIGVLKSLLWNQHNEMDSRIRVSCAGVLVNMSSGGRDHLSQTEHTQMRERIQGLTDINAISVLISSLRASTNNLELTSVACEFFSNMCIDFFKKTTNISNRHISNRHIMRSSNCLAVVLESMGKYETNAMLQQNVCYFLSQIMNVEDKRPSQSEDLIIHRVFAAMTTHFGNTNVQQQGCLVLCVLARNSATACARFNTTHSEDIIFHAILMMPHSKLPIAIETLRLARASSRVITG